MGGNEDDNKHSYFLMSTSEVLKTSGDIEKYVRPMVWSTL
jgi:hypothetical protein